ncbi:MAG: hypothetical protein ACUVXJ_14055 [Phycisphaerae bacterium]
MDLDAALNVVAMQGRNLRERLCLPWQEQAQQAVCALRFRRQAAATGQPIQLAAIVGGASSGKSTVFNNLLGGHRVSLVTIRSHATRGLIVAAHQKHCDRLDRWLHHDRTLLPTLESQPGCLDADLQGRPEAATVVLHDVAGFEDSLLIDTADFTSNTAELEGDVTLSLLPWFDRLVVIVDHERWFDRQVVDQLALLAKRFAQPRAVIFNRTAEEALAQPDRTRLEEQARHLGAEKVCILNYHRGRGFRRFDPQALAEISRFLAQPPPRREPALHAEIARQAAAVLSANRIRLECLHQLERVLADVAARCVPATRWDCVTALMTREERDRLGVVSRILGISQMREWLGRQKRWLEEAMPRLPWAGRRETSPEPDPALTEKADASREERGRDWLNAQCERQIRRLNEEVTASDFWDDLRTAHGHPPLLSDHEMIDSFRPRAEETVTRLASAMDEWNARVQHECEGISPKLIGSLGMTILAGAAILIAVPGPIAAMTPVIAAGALKAGLLKLGAAGAFGALSARPLARLTEIIREKLLASTEFNRVREAAESMRRLIEEHGRAAADYLSQEARTFTLAPEDPLRQALEVLSRHEGQSA